EGENGQCHNQGNEAYFDSEEHNSLLLNSSVSIENAEILKPCRLENGPAVVIRYLIAHITTFLTCRGRNDRKANTHICNHKARCRPRGQNRCHHSTNHRWRLQAARHENGRN